MKKEGFLLINKPEGMTSYDVIRYIKPIFGKTKIGHAGTLDPFASGLLLVAVGAPFTKQLAKLQLLNKRYVFRMVLGLETDTLDCDGKLTKTSDASSVDKGTVEAIIQNFLGPQKQLPPQFSAKKKDGKKAYEVARKGGVITLDPVDIYIEQFQLLAFKGGKQPLVDCDVTCSKGTYIRTLASDLAKACGTVSYTKSLIRTAIGPFQLDQAHDLKDLNRDTIHEQFCYELQH